MRSSILRENFGSLSLLRFFKCKQLYIKCFHYYVNNYI
nr:MAG TPA: hypothetical protein [Caudoviricetes sp.]